MGKKKREARSSKFENDAMEKIYDINERALAFAARVMKMKRALLKDQRVNKRAMAQVVDSSSSIYANLQEARGTATQADFHAKVRIALKEARESHGWLKYLRASECVTPKLITPLICEADEIVAILVTIAKKVNPTNPAPPPD